MDGSLRTASKPYLSEFTGLLALRGTASMGCLRWSYNRGEEEAMAAYGRGRERAGKISEEVTLVFGTLVPSSSGQCGERNLAS